MKIKTNSIKRLADMVVPVGLYLTVRKYYGNALLLESSDYHSKEDSLSLLCFDPISTIVLTDGSLDIDGKIHKDFDLAKSIREHINGIDIVQDEISERYNGFFGFNTFDAVQHYESINFDKSKNRGLTPLMRYDLFRFVVVFDHYYNELYLIENQMDGEESRLTEIESLVFQGNPTVGTFSRVGEVGSEMEDADYKEMVSAAKSHCKRGDVFQLVLSRRFRQSYKGDDFNVYRALRSINPSPYLFYFDYGDYHIFGSSPEAQLIVRKRIAEIHPIAGTFRRTGDMVQDQKLAEQLANDKKESSEHVMLVDLARNDLSKNTTDVTVDSFKEAQYFSHVIHLVSKVTGELKPNKSAYQVYADTFPAGTLSGAPKYKAMQLIDKYEPHNRGIYGGGIGMLQFNGDINKAIIIRSFLSKDNTLYWQAGAGLVIESDEESELQEVNNKLAALIRALEIAEEL